MGVNQQVRPFRVLTAIENWRKEYTDDKELIERLWQEYDLVTSYRAYKSYKKGWMDTDYSSYTAPALKKMLGALGERV